jgi:cytochrome c nitrite reductase small subunit
MAAPQRELKPGPAKALGIAAIVLCLTIGLAGGLGAYTFNFAHGLSYFSNDPKACVNCHVMNDYYDSWQKSGHGHVAVCNDCHSPHNIVGKLITKADNGWNHSVKFTLRTYEKAPIVIRKVNADRLRHNCIHCHENLVSDIRGAEALYPASAHGAGTEDIDCLRCHSDVGHGPRR